MTTPTPPDSGTGSVFARKVGPLPVWAWVGLVLAAALGWQYWRRSRSGTAASTSATSSATPNASQTPPVVWQNYITVPSAPIGETLEPIPPSGGRTEPPPVPPHPPLPGGPGRRPPPVTGGGTPTPVPRPRPGGQWVTVSKWSATNPPWSSTLWGIAQQLLGNGGRWSDIWARPENAGLVSRRKDPKLIQPGDKVFVPPK